MNLRRRLQKSGSIPRTHLIAFGTVVLLSPYVTGAHAADVDCAAFISQGPPTHEVLLADGWQLTNESDDVRVYNRKAAKSPFYEVLARTRIAASPDRVYSVVTDFAHYSEFMPYTAVSTIRKITESDTWVFQRLDFHIPFVSDRHYTVKVVAHPCDGMSQFRGTVWDQVDDVPLPENESPAIVPRVNSGAWSLWPLDNAQATDAAYYLHSDPGGSIPTFLVNMANRSALPDVVDIVSRRAQEPER